MASASTATTSSRYRMVGPCSTHPTSCCDAPHATVARPPPPAPPAQGKGVGLNLWAAGSTYRMGSHACEIFCWRWSFDYRRLNSEIKHDGHIRGNRAEIP